MAPLWPSSPPYDTRESDRPRAKGPSYTRQAMHRRIFVVIGAGLAGLACARVLAKAGVPFTLLEASNGVGGRVRTDVVDGRPWHLAGAIVRTMP